MINESSRSVGGMCRAGCARTPAVDSSHVPMLSQPAFVLDVIREAAKAVRGASATV